METRQYVIVIKMPPFAISRFLEGDYYKIADVKMLYFFTKMTTTTFVALLLLFILSFDLMLKKLWHSKPISLIES